MKEATIYLIIGANNENANPTLEGVFATKKTALENLKIKADELRRKLAEDWGIDKSAIDVDVDGDHAYISDDNVTYEFAVVSTNVKLKNHKISKRSINAAEEILVDNGVEADEAEVVLQAIGFALLDVDLYPEE